MANRKANGEGSLYHRGDGRWGGSAFVDTVSGQRKRIHVYASTRQEVHDRLADKLAVGRRGIRAPDKEWTVGAYLDYWLASVVTVKNRPRTAEQYESTVRLYLKPALGTIRLTKLTVQDVQTLLNTHLAQGRSIRAVQLVRSVLRAALSRAEREELIVRNVAKLIDLPAWERKPIQPWSVEEASTFLAATKAHRLYPAFVMLLLYGMRRGEVLGLRWCDVDFARDQLHVRQQLQRIGQNLEQGPVKTSAGRRDLPLIAMLRDGLTSQYASRHGTELDAVAECAGLDQGLVFLSSTGTPIDPKNFVRTFHQIRVTAGLPRITVHHTRHTTATMLKNLGVPARDAQLILGHAHVTTTQQLYQHGDIEGQARALERIEARVIGSQQQGALLSRVLQNGTYPQVKARYVVHSPLEGQEGLEPSTPCLRVIAMLVNSTPTTPVIRHLRTRAYAHILGWVAVKYCCKMGSDNISTDADIADWVAILHALRRLETHTLAQKCFPLNLLPATRSRASDPPSQAPLHETHRSRTPQEGHTT